MDDTQLLITVVGSIMTLVALVRATRRMLSARADYMYATSEKIDPQASALEIAVARVLYHDKLLRLSIYVGIFLLFAVAFVYPAGTSRFVRTGLIVYIFVIFAIEETYLDRAEERWRQKRGTS